MYFLRNPLNFPLCYENVTFLPYLKFLLFFFFKPEIRPISTPYPLYSVHYKVKGHVSGLLASSRVGVDHCDRCAAGRWRHLPLQSADGRNTAGNLSLIRRLCGVQASPATSRHVMSRPLMFLGTRRGKEVFTWSRDHHQRPCFCLQWVWNWQPLLFIPILNRLSYHAPL